GLGDVNARRGANQASGAVGGEDRERHVSRVSSGGDDRVGKRTAEIAGRRVGSGEGYAFTRVQQATTGGRERITLRSGGSEGDGSRRSISHIDVIKVNVARIANCSGKAYRSAEGGREGRAVAHALFGDRKARMNDGDDLLAAAQREVG